MDVTYRRFFVVPQRSTITEDCNRSQKETTRLLIESNAKLAEYMVKLCSNVRVGKVMELGIFVEISPKPEEQFARYCWRIRNALGCYIAEADATFHLFV